MSELIDTSAVKKPKGGVDMGDHPPITPMRCAAADELDGNEWRVYDMISRHFIASLSPNCSYAKTSATYAIGQETFKCKGVRLIDAGWTALIPRQAVRDEGVVDHSLGMVLTDVVVSEGKTSPPGYLTESDLISWMEANGIGTDASIATHINTVCVRNYVTVQGGDRSMVPTEMGISLVHGYYRVDPDLVLPNVRSQIEKYIDLVATGKATFEQVVPHAIEVFRSKYQYFVSHISRMDELFEAHFSPLTETAGKSFSRCGVCRRFMKFISHKPMRLYCPTCEETYALPQNGSIKKYKELTCPIDEFELLLYITGKNPSKSVPLCPMCFNHPPFENMAQKSGCNTCPNAACKHSMVRNQMFDCPEPGCKGAVVLDANSRPHWKAACNVCKYLFKLPQDAKSIAVSRTRDCQHCGSALLKVDFHPEKSPLAVGVTKFTGCVWCDHALTSTCSEASVGRFVSSRFTRGRGRGRKRGTHRF